MNFFIYVATSLRFDFIFLFKVKFNVFKKIWFIFLKYTLLIKNLFYYKYGKSSIKMFGHDFYFPNKYGLLSLQRVFVDNFYLKEYIGTCQTVIDVGAHIGEFHIFAKEYLGADIIYSFEPYQKSFLLLDKNTAGKNNYNYAVSNQEEAKLYISKVSTQLNSLNPTTETNHCDVETCKCVKLDDIFTDSNKKFDLLKIDAEGHEYIVLQTAVNLLKRCKYVLIELGLNNSSDPLATMNFIMQANSNFHIIAFSDYRLGQSSIDVLLSSAH